MSLAYLLTKGWDLPNMSKQEKIFHVSLCIFALELSKGHLRWKVTELVRKSGMSRPVIYRYLGGSREEMLIAALNVFCSEFYGLDGNSKKQSFATMIGKARELMQQYPEAVIFYQKWRSRESFIQNEFIRIEARFRKKLHKYFPHFDEDQIQVAHTCIHGLVTSPFLTPTQTIQVCQSLSLKGIL